MKGEMSMMKASECPANCPSEMAHAKKHPNPNHGKKSDKKMDSSHKKNMGY